MHICCCPPPICGRDPIACRDRARVGPSHVAWPRQMTGVLPGNRNLSVKLTILLRYHIRVTTETGECATCKVLAVAAGAPEEMVEHIIVNECKGTRPRFLYLGGGPSTPSLCQAYAKQAQGTVGGQWWPTTNGNDNVLDNDNEHFPSKTRSRTGASTRSRTESRVPPWRSQPKRQRNGRQTRQRNQRQQRRKGIIRFQKRRKRRRRSQQRKSPNRSGRQNRGTCRRRRQRRLATKEDVPLAGT